MNLNAPIRLRKIKTFKNHPHNFKIIYQKCSYVELRSRSTSCRFHSDQMNSRSIEWFMVLLLWSERAPQSCVVRYGCRDLTCENTLCSLAEEHRLRSSDGPDEGLEPRSVHDWLSAYGMRFLASRWKVQSAWSDVLGRHPWSPPEDHRLGTS